MRLFTKTVVVKGGLSSADARALEHLFEHLAGVLKERFEGLDKEIAELRAEIAHLKQEPRTSLAQRIQARGRYAA